MNSITGRWEHCWRDDEGFYTILVSRNGDYLEVSGFTQDELVEVFGTMTKARSIGIQLIGEEVSDGEETA